MALIWPSSSFRRGTPLQRACSSWLSRLGMPRTCTNEAFYTLAPILNRICMRK